LPDPDLRYIDALPEILRRAIKESPFGADAEEWYRRLRTCDDPHREARILIRELREVSEEYARRLRDHGIPPAWSDYEKESRRPRRLRGIKI